jgi:cbb3-type cytochrome oxidase maturation protein
MNTVQPLILLAEPALPEPEIMPHGVAYVHGSWFGIGDGTVIMWPLVWVLLPIGLFAIVALLWAAKHGQFRNAQEIAERQLEIED